MFWTVLHLNRLAIQLIFLILLSGSIIKSGLPSFPFFTLRIPFLLKRLACMVTSTGHWQKLTNNPLLDCPSLQPPSEVLKASFQFNVQNGLCCSLVMPPWQRSLTFMVSLTVVRKSPGGASTCTTDSIRRGAMGDGILMCYSFQLHHHHLHLLCMLVVMKGHHLQFRCCPPLFHNFRQFWLKAALAQKPIVLKEVGELVVKIAFEPSTGAAGFSSNVFAVPKHTGVSSPILNLK